MMIEDDDEEILNVNSKGNGNFEFPDTQPSR